MPATTDRRPGTDPAETHPRPAPARPPSRPGSAGTHGWRRWFKIGFWLAASAGAVWYLVATWPRTGPALGRIGWAAALLALVPAGAALIASMLAWRRLLADLGSPLPVRPAGRVYFTSQLGKYLPGSVWTVLAQAELGRDLKVPRAVSFAASALAVTLSLTVGLGLALALLPFGDGVALRRFWWLWLVAPALLAVLHPRVTTGGMNLALRLLRRPPLSVRPSARGTLTAAGWQALSWVLLGLHCFLLVRAAGAAGWPALPLAVGGFALAYCAGVLFVPTPAGVGVRELALGAALSTTLTAEAAVAVVLVSRLALALVDLGMAGAWAGNRYAHHLQGAQMTTAAPPGGAATALAKRVAETALWTRVRLRRRLAAPPARPAPVPPTEVLRTRADWAQAVARCRRLRLPLHHDRPKNWDALGAVSTILDRLGTGAAVLDAGSARYSPVLPWLRLYGLRDLVGNNLEFGAEVHRDGVLFRYGDITATDFPDGRFDAVTCMSVVEHGVPVEPFLAESARILRPGGLLIVSTDYDQRPPDTTGLTAYGQPVRIFSPEQIEELVAGAARYGLRLLGELAFDHPERPVHWARLKLDYTFIRLTFAKAGPDR